MSYNYYKEPYYEPSIANEIYEEALEKLKEVLKDDIKNNIKFIQEENTRLKKENEELKKKSRDLDIKEHSLQMREKDLESRLERNFYKSKFSELLKPLEEQLDMWYVDRTSELIPKCNLCDNDRKVVYKSGTGKELKGDCDCRKHHTVYRVENDRIKYLNFFKSDRDRKFIMTPKYESQGYDDNYFKLETQELVKTFNIEEVSNYKYYGGYGGFTGFATKEECQKYCDYLNNKENKA